MNVDDQEIKKFDKIADLWWDTKGEMGSLHKINPLRMQFIQERLDLHGSKILDVGCGGGIFSEAMADAGAQVTGIDLSRNAVEVARQHAALKGLNIDYRVESLDDTVQEWSQSFDVVTCMEMLEHVPSPLATITGCVRALKPEGHFFCSTINRTPKAFLFAIVGGEYILHLLPRGSHQFSKLIRPVELNRWAEASGLKFINLASPMYNPIKRKFSLVPGKVDINYLMHFIKR